MKVFYYVLLVACLASSCYVPRYAYSPAALEVPVLRGRGDGQVAAAYSTNLSKHSRGLDAGASIAITDHLALQAGLFTRRERNEGYDINDSTVIRYKRNMSEFSIGYYTPLDAQQEIYFQVFAGTSFGKFSLDDQSLVGNQISRKQYYRARMNKIFIQPSFQFLPSENFSVSLSTQLSSVRFNNRLSDYSAEELNNYHLDYLDKNFTFIQFALTQSFGFKSMPNIRFQYQFGLGGQLSHYPLYDRKATFSIGGLYRFNSSTKGRKASKKQD